MTNTSRKLTIQQLGEKDEGYIVLHMTEAQVVSSITSKQLGEKDEGCTSRDRSTSQHLGEVGEGCTSRDRI